ncbi:hypothetical protein DL93DRAFT_2077249 [Clavulina sp. PMI_390]|nr:hypothetical protein DL93DRAFT_2077249 [Clavulina sp. PMI_390]
MAPYIINLVGGLGAGVVAYSTLIGIVSVQAWTYFDKFKKDRIAIKLAVAGLMIYDLFQLFVLGYSIYQHAIPNWKSDNTTNLVIITWEITMFQVGIIVSSVVTQGFLVFRMWQLTRGPVLPIMIAIMIVVHFTLGIIVQVKAVSAVDFWEIMRNDRAICMAWLSCAAFVDTIIGLGMCFHLYRRKTGFRQTDNLLRTMMVFAINTGLATGIVSLVVVIVFSFDGFAWLVMFGGVPLGGLYSTTLLANIHSRTIFKRKLEGGKGDNIIPLEQVRKSEQWQRRPSMQVQSPTSSSALFTPSTVTMATSTSTAGTFTSMDGTHNLKLAPIEERASNEIVVGVHLERHVVVDDMADDEPLADAGAHGFQREQRGPLQRMSMSSVIR